MLHDYRDEICTWGHSITYTPYDDHSPFTALGFGRGISEGDYLLLSNKDSTTRYKVASISYFHNVTDQWAALLVFAPRTDEERAQEPALPKRYLDISMLR